MADFVVLPAPMRTILVDPVRFILLRSNKAVYHCVSKATTMNSSLVTMEQLTFTTLTTEQAALIAIAMFGVPWLCSKCLDGYLIQHRYFKCRRWLQKLKILDYQKETISIPDRQPHIDCEPHSYVSIQPVLHNFPDPKSVTVHYIDEDGQRLGSYSPSMSSLLLVDAVKLGRVTAMARDPYGYEAQCSFQIIKDDNEKDDGDDEVDNPIQSICKDKNQNQNCKKSSAPSTALATSTTDIPTLVTPDLITTLATQSVTHATLTPVTPTMVTPASTPYTPDTPDLVTTFNSQPATPTNMETCYPTLATPAFTSDASTPVTPHSQPVTPATTVTLSSANPTLDASPDSPTLDTPDLVTTSTLDSQPSTPSSTANTSLANPTIVTPSSTSLPKMATNEIVTPSSENSAKSTEPVSNEKEPAKAVISQIVRGSRKLDLLIEEYEQIASDLLAWIRKTTPWLENRTLPKSTLPQIQDKLKGFKNYRCGEKSKKLEEKCALDSAFNTMQTKLSLHRQPAYRSSERKMIADIMKEWKHLEQSESNYEAWLMAEMKRLQRLDYLAKHFMHKCDIHEAWSNGKDELLRDNDLSTAKLYELNALHIKHEAFASHLVKHHNDVKGIEEIVQEMKELSYEDISTINEQYKRICDQFDILGSLSQQRGDAISDKKQLLLRIDALHTEFATKVSSHSTKVDTDIEKMQDPLLVHSVKEIQIIAEEHTRFKETLNAAEGEYTEIVQIADEVKHIGQSSGQDSAFENPYTALQIEEFTSKWSELQQLEPERESALELEASRQQSNENLRQKFAQQVNAAGTWIEKLWNAVEDQQGTNDLRQYEKMVIGYKPHMEELEACNQTVQEAMIFENLHTNYTMEKIHTRWDPLLPTIRLKINKIENQTIKLRRASQSISEDQLSEFRTSFDHFDKKQQESLTPEQFRSCLISLGYEVQADEKGDQEFQDTMEEVDPNDTKEITFPNFLHYMTREAVNEADNPKQITNAFKVLAKNKAYITESDLRRLPQDKADYCIAHMKPYKDGPKGALDYVNFSIGLYENNE